MTGINGLRLFCSEVGSKFHYKRKKVLEFTGGIGDWGNNLFCKNEKWVTKVQAKYGVDTETEHWGIVQLRVKCQSFDTDEEATSEGRILPHNYELEHDPGIPGTQGTLETELPALSNADKERWETVIACPSHLPVVGARVQTDQEFDLGTLAYELKLGSTTSSADMIGINNIKLACNIYGKVNLCIKFKNI